MASIDGDALATDDAYRAAVVDLLGVLAYGELMAFERLAADAALAPTIDDEAQLAGMAAAEFRHFSRLRDRLVEIGADPAAAMQPFRAPLERFHEMTAPSDWLEGLVKAYVGDGIGVDFYREIATYLDPQTQALVLEVCEDLGQSAFVVDRVRAAIAQTDLAPGRELHTTASVGWAEIDRDMAGIAAWMAAADAALYAAKASGRQRSPEPPWHRDSP